MKCEYCNGGGCKRCMSKGGYVPEDQGGMEEGVHKNAYWENRPKDKVGKALAGESLAGVITREGEASNSKDKSKKKYAEAKGEHEKVLGQMKKLPKPKLEGLAKGGVVHSKGVHEPVLDLNSKKGMSSLGSSAAGMKAKHPESHQDIVDSKEMHQQNLEELQDMPKPKLKGFAQGGNVNLHDQAVAGAMSRGEGDVGSSEKEKYYDEGGDVSADDEMLDMCCDELMNAFEKKDKKEILESLKAIILSVKG